MKNDLFCRRRLSQNLDFVTEYFELKWCALSKPLDKVVFLVLFFWLPSIACIGRNSGCYTIAPSNASHLILQALLFFDSVISVRAEGIYSPLKKNAFLFLACSILSALNWGWKAKRNRWNKTRVSISFPMSVETHRFMVWSIYISFLRNMRTGQKRWNSNFRRTTSSDNDSDE